MVGATNDWHGILDADEAILWQGRPDTAVVFQVRNIFTLIFGLFFSGFAVFWMLMASQAGGMFWMFGLLHFLVGVGVAFGPFLWSPWIRRHTWYTLTTTRAFIATNRPMAGKALKSYPITKETVLEFADGDPASVYFARYHKSTKNGSTEVPVGFERISAGKEVYSMMRNIQRGKHHA